MTTRTIADVIREIANHHLETGEPVTVPLNAMVANLKGLKNAMEIPFDEMEAEIAAMRKRMTPSYIATVVNRMEKVQAQDKSCTVKFGFDPDRGLATLCLATKAGRVNVEPKSSKRAESRREAEEKARASYLTGLSDGLAVMASFVPDFIDYTPEEFEIAQKVVKQYRDHAVQVKEAK